METWKVSQPGEAGKACIEFLRTRDLSAGMYRLPAGGVDAQNPHGEEEIYYVIRGRAQFRAGQQDVAVSAPDVLFVPRGEPHRFHDIAEDLDVPVLFAPAEGSRK